MATVHRTAAQPGCICFTLPFRQAFVGVVRAGADEYRTRPFESAAIALLEALRIGAQLRRQVPALLLALTLTGCATCREHPTACKAVAAAVVAGTVIALDHRRAASGPAQAPLVHRPICSAGPC